ncbi:hypothetical protein Hanom_Chr00s000002g01600431 [Helianthus anomalus]
MFGFEPGVFLEAASLSIWIEVRFIYIPPSQTLPITLLFVGIAGYCCCCCCFFVHAPSLKLFYLRLIRISKSRFLQQKCKWN